MQNTPKMPPIYISKYNRFVDNIVGRINRILGKSYDPVRVKIQSNQSSKKSNKRKVNNKTRKNSNKQKSTQHMTNKMAEIAIARGVRIDTNPTESTFVMISKTTNAETRKNPNTRSATTGKKQKTKTKQSSSQKKQKPRATLFGLSTIRRDGDVSVNMMSNHTTVKTNFLLGPLTLRVEKEFGSGAKREVKSATATTAEMHGRLNLRIVHGGAATLHSIRVLQPKQMRVDSADNHEKTKEFMWRRSAHIASLVSQKLMAATRSMLKPPPST